ncbi:MAG: hypothetical protein ACFB15_12035 [Cyclobacteriaceae bacterium]
MSITQKGARKIIVASEVYHWLIQKKATHSQSDYGIGKVHVAIELAEKSGSTLIVFTNRKHPKDWSTIEVVPVVPSDVKKWTLNALELG